MARQVWVLLVSAVLLSGVSDDAISSVALGDAMVARHGAAQREYVEGFIAAKSGKGTPAKSLAASHFFANSGDDHPSLDMLAMAKDPIVSGDAWLSHAEQLYAGGQYVQSGIALQNLPESYREMRAGRVESLLNRLALRGVGKGVSGIGTQDESPAGMLNSILLQVKKGDLNDAIERITALAIGEAVQPEVRQRAAVWRAVFLNQAGKRQDALDVLAKVDGASIYLLDSLLGYVRINPDVPPQVLAAVERVLLDKANDTDAVWEVREYLIKALLDKGASGQAQALAIDAIARISETLKLQSQELSKYEKLAFDQLISSLGRVSEDRRHRITTLVALRENLKKTSELLGVWNPYLRSYADRLKTDRVQFSGEIHRAIDDLKRSDDGTQSKGALLGMELGNLFGRPSDPNVVYRLFFGLSLWDFSYEYPEAWRPPTEDVKELSRTERRRARIAAQRGGRDESKVLAKALEHSKKLQLKVTEALANAPRFVFEGLDQEADALRSRGLAQAAEIQKFLPQLDGAIRSEFIQEVKERRQIAQQWLNRYAHYVLEGVSRGGGSGEQPVFGLDDKLSLRAGEPIGQSISAIQSNIRRLPAKDASALPVRDALRAVVVDGETRQIRADALRLRARLVVALNEMQAISSAAEAATDYSVLLGEYGDLVDRADVTYQLARAQDLSQKMEASLATLEGFVRDFKGDPRAVEATFRVGEIHFSFSENSRAKLAYESVVNQGDTPYRDQAEYKLGWTFFRMGEYRSALPRFVDVVNRGYASRGSGDKTQPGRVQDAVRAISLVFSHLSGPAEVEQFFKGKAVPDYVSTIYSGLTRHYLEQKRVREAVTGYAYLVKHYPDDARTPALLAAVISAARVEKLPRLASDLQEQFMERYSVSGSYWAKAAPNARAEISALIKPLLSDSAKMYHADGQQNKSPVSYAKAIRFYQQYISTFPDDENTARFHFLLAEARFETGDTLGAMRDYERAAYDYGAHEKASEAGYALLIATQKQADAEKDSGERKVKIRLLVSRSSRFAAAFVGDARVDAVLIKAGEDILMLGEAEEAVRLSSSLLARQPSEAVARRALTVFAHGSFESGAFSNAESSYVKLLAFKGFSVKEQKDLNERLALSVYRQGESFRAAGEDRSAIETFLRVVKVAPGTEPVPNAEIDASALLLSSKRWGEAIEVLERFSRNYANHPLIAEVPVRLAFAYESDGRFIKAADMLESLSLAEKDDALARQMLWRSAELREKGDRMDLAVLTFERYLVRYPQPLEKASEVRQSLADIAGKTNDLKTRDRWLMELITHTKAAGGVETVRVRYLAAMASVTFGDGKASEFNAIKLKLPLDKSLVEKRSAMEAGLRWYEEAGRYGIAEVTTAATYKTAELYRGLARDVMASERPSGLSPLEKEQYAILLEEEAAPFEEKATDLHELNYKRIPGGVYDAWVKRSLVSLSAINPGRYERPEIVVPYFSYVMPKLPSAGRNGASSMVVPKPGGANAQMAR